MLNEFVECGVLVEVKTDDDKEIVYQPGVTETRFDVKFLFDSLDKKGVNFIPINDTEDLKHVNIMMDKLDRLMNSELGHTKLKDLVV
jgi:hypothetical protein